MSIESLPLMNCIPEMVDITTPEISVNSDTNEIPTKDIHDLLLKAGYIQSEIDSILQNISKKAEQNSLRSRPKTQVFWQGRTFTYDQLVVTTEFGAKKRKGIQASNRQIKS